jgi:hypothetical protein
MGRLTETGTVVLALVVVAAMTPAAYADEPTTVDCLTSHESSVALRNEHKLRAARAKLLVCSSVSCPEDVRDECIQRVAEVEAATPTVVFEAKDADDDDLTNVTVKMDGERLAERLDGTALALDPGLYTFQFEVAGQPAIQKELVIGEGEKDRRERVVFAGLGVPPAASGSNAGSTGGGPAATVASAGRVPAAAPPMLGGPRRTVAVFAAAAAVVAIGVGATEGVIAWRRKAQANDVCPDTCAPGSLGASRWSSATSAGNWSTAFFVAGGVLAAGAVVVWKAGGSARGTPTARLGLAPDALLLSGRW